MIQDDPFNLQRFISAQSSVYDQVRNELKTGKKLSHWMWFIFPQMTGLGHSSMANHFAISSLSEAQAYLDHKILGPRLKECAKLLLDVEGKAIRDILGSPDDMKLRSSMTMFEYADPQIQLFKAIIDKYFEGQQDEASINIIRLQGVNKGYL